MVQKILEKVNKENIGRLVYLTQYGSTLYGTNNENSDIDYKGIFVPDKTDVLLKRDHENFSANTNTSGLKNTSDDIDFELWSVYKFFKLIQKGETGALDIMFSMFRDDTIVYQDEEFVKTMKEHYKKFLNRRLHSFVGYCVGQSKKYNIKGNRYKELVDFKKKLYVWSDKIGKLKLESNWDHLKSWVEAQNYKYIKFVMAPGPGTRETRVDIEYIEVLGSKFPGTVLTEFFYNKVDEMESQFGHRTRAQVQNDVDWKALSHAVRVINEVEELLDTEFITFPLLEKDYVKSVKEGKESLADVMDYIDTKLDLVNIKLETSGLQDNSDVTLMNNVLLGLLDE